MRALLGRHGHALAAVGRAVGHFSAPQPGLAGLGQLVLGVLLTYGKVPRHATIHHVEGNAVLAREHAHRCATGQKVLHHLPGHIHGVSRHALGGQSVVGGKHHHLRRFKLGRVSAQNARHAQRLLLQHAKRAHGLGLEIQLVLYALLQIRIVNIPTRGQDQMTDKEESEKSEVGTELMHAVIPGASKPCTDHHRDAASTLATALKYRAFNSRSFALGMKIDTPHSPLRVVAAPPRGMFFILGRPGDEKGPKGPLLVNAGSDYWFTGTSTVDSRRMPPSFTDPLTAPCLTRSAQAWRSISVLNTAQRANALRSY